MQKFRNFSTLFNELLNIHPYVRTYVHDSTMKKVNSDQKVPKRTLPLKYQNLKNPWLQYLHFREEIKNDGNGNK